MTHQQQIYKATLRVLTCNELTTSELKILMALASMGEMKMSHLMIEAGFNSPNASLMAKMVNARLVNKLRYLADQDGNQRVHKYSISKLGEIALQKAFAPKPQPRKDYARN